MNNTDKKIWHPIYTRSRNEKFVAKQLQGKGIEAFVPCWRHIVFHNNKKYIFYPPLFSGYAFARMSRPECREALSIRGVVHVVGENDDFNKTMDDSVAFLRSPYCIENVRPYEGSVTGENIYLRIDSEHRILGSLVESSPVPLFVFTMPAIDMFGYVNISKSIAIENIQ